MTKAPVNASAMFGDENTYWKATRYICVGSAAFSSGTRWRTARKARNEPASSFRTPGMIQPGPADRLDIHHATRFSLLRAGRNRRKATCSPICGSVVFFLVAQIGGQVDVLGFLAARH